MYVAIFGVDNEKRNKGTEVIDSGDIGGSQEEISNPAPKV